MLLNSNEIYGTSKNCSKTYVKMISTVQTQL